MLWISWNVVDIIMPYLEINPGLTNLVFLSCIWVNQVVFMKSVIQTRMLH